MISFSDLCRLMSDGTDGKICMGFHISPIEKADYNFFIVDAPAGMRLLYGSHRVREYLEFVKSSISDQFSYTDFLQNAALIKAFIPAYKERFYQEKILPPDIKELVSAVRKLDFSAPQISRSGLDGFSLYCWLPGMDKELVIWCCHYDEYYSAVTDLVNTVLDAASVDAKYRFSTYRSKPAR